jgi:hypothetical protein
VEVYDTVSAHGCRETNLPAQNCIDNSINTPQYLVLRTPPMLRLGQQLEIRPFTTLQGKIVHGGNFMPAKKKAKKKKKH